MLGSGRVLRVTVLGVRVHVCSFLAPHPALLESEANDDSLQDARCYSVHVAAESDDTNCRIGAGPIQTGASARTETAHLSVNPDFVNNTFLLRLPRAMAASLKPQAVLTCQLWATPTVERGIAHVRVPAPQQHIRHSLKLKLFAILSLLSSVLRSSSESMPMQSSPPERSQQNEDTPDACR
jgi:hypothetical protein